jgi:CBS domain-containing protein
MGILSTAIAFGAGYALRANRDSDLGQQITTKLRETTSQRMRLGSGNGSGPGGVTDVRLVSEVMTAMPETVSPTTTLHEAAQRMRDADIGDVLVGKDGGGIQGIVTDRDIAIRAVAEGRDPSTTTVASVLSGDLQSVSPSDTIQVAAARMRSANVRRLPVMEAGRAVGIVSLGDLAIATDSGATLADISVASPDR